MTTRTSDLRLIVATLLGDFPGNVDERERAKELIMSALAEQASDPDFDEAVREEIARLEAALTVLRGFLP
jgi:hypothetical protein